MAPVEAARAPPLGNEADQPVKSSSKLQARLQTAT